MDSVKRIGFLIAVALGSLPQQVQGATRRVPSEYATINAALDASVSGDTVLVAAGLYGNPETRVINTGGGGPAPVTSLAFLKNGITLISESGSAATTLDMSGGAGADFGWAITAVLLPGETIVEGFTFTHLPQRGVGVYARDCGAVTVRDCSFEATGAEVDTVNALAFIEAPGRALDCRFEGLRSTGSGSAISSYPFSVEIDGCEFVDCAARNGVLRVIGAAQLPGQELVVRNCGFRGNSGGGGIAFVTPGFQNGVVEGCTFIDNEATNGQGGAVVVNPGNVAFTLRENVFRGNRAPGPPNLARGGAAYVGAGSGPVEITGNTFRENFATGLGAALYLGSGGGINVSNNVFSENLGSAAIGKSAGALGIQLDCNVFWDNPDGDTDGFPLGATDRVIDPLYCGAKAGDLTLSSLSPCLPVNSMGCGLIGALGQGCGTVSVEPMSWSRIKGAYR
jgi:hypothetical protein